MCLVRLPVDRDGLHLVELYDEVAVVVVPRDHFATAGTEVELADLADEQLVLPHRLRLDADGRPARLAADERARGRRGGRVRGRDRAAADVGRPPAPAQGRRQPPGHRPAADPVGLAWLVARDDEQTQAMVGVVRGRTGRSSRG